MRKKKIDSFVIHKVFINSLGLFMAVEIANSLSKTIDGMITGHFLGSMELAASGLASPISVLLVFFRAFFLWVCSQYAQRVWAKEIWKRPTDSFQL